MSYPNQYNPDDFGDDFEVTYDGDDVLESNTAIHSEDDFIEITADDYLSEDSVNDPLWETVGYKVIDETIEMPVQDYRPVKKGIPLKQEKISKPVKQTKKPAYQESLTEELFARRLEEGPQTNESPEMAATIRRGGLRLTFATRRFVRALSFFLFLGMAAYMGIDFFRGSVVYGDAIEALSDQAFSMKLIGYFIPVILLLLMEISFAFYSLTRVTMQDSYGYYKEDIGHGLAGYIFTYLTSYLCFWISSYVPDFMDVLKGFKGALNVYGAMHNALFGFCIAGAIACLIRKFGVVS